MTSDLNTRAFRLSGQAFSNNEFHEGLQLLEAVLEARHRVLESAHPDTLRLQLETIESLGTVRSHMDAKRPTAKVGKAAARRSERAAAAPPSRSGARLATGIPRQETDVHATVAAAGYLGFNQEASVAERGNRRLQIVEDVLGRFVPDPAGPTPTEPTVSRAAASVARPCNISGDVCLSEITGQAPELCTPDGWQIESWPGLSSGDLWPIWQAACSHRHAAPLGPSQGDSSGLNAKTA